MTDEQIALPALSRFSNRAENYIQYRPAYLKDLLTFLEQQAGLTKMYRVADIGSGTGRFAELFLKNGYKVSAIEPNDEMRQAADSRLGLMYPSFSSLPGTGEDTGLDSNSIDLITVAQAFHWMNIDAAREEFRRILRPGGKIVLAWTIRQTQTPFLFAYDQLKRQFRGKDIPPLIDEEKIKEFYSPLTVNRKVFPHSVWMNFDALKGLLLSSSGIPLPGQIGYDTMISSLVQLFVAFNQNGFVNMEYETVLYWA